MTAHLDPVLDQWIARFRGPLTGLLASWGADWGEAEELAMDTFAEAWLGRERLRGSMADSRVVGPWLRGIAANLHRSRQRSARRLRLEPLHEDAAVAPSPEHPDERLDVLRAAFALLRTDQQMVLRMFYLDEASTREVAALLMLTEKAVEGRLHQARRALREKADRLLAATAGGSR
ncbi:MAG: sigma-70 family RNA polymerase sigma factor [Planctomycetes bacterium]|nr:sigma-70 family RNA polymerase sigma factor [Planctomycetota bacterium]MCB9885938.1 sigma-70 family RNA polymerase sigma factor [Planctomycetota bacterium]